MTYSNSLFLRRFSPNSWTYCWYSLSASAKCFQNESMIYCFCPNSFSYCAHFHLLASTQSFVSSVSCNLVAVVPINQSTSLMIASISLSLAVDGFILQSLVFSLSTYCLVSFPNCLIAASRVSSFAPSSNSYLMSADLSLLLGSAARSRIPLRSSLFKWTSWTRLRSLSRSASSYLSFLSASNNKSPRSCFKKSLILL